MIEGLYNIIKSDEIILFFIIFFFLLKKMDIDNEENFYKIGILNIVMYLLCFFNIFDVFSVLVIYIAVTFIYIQILSADDFQKELIRKPLMLIIDYFYKMFFNYGLLWVVIALVCSSDLLKNCIFSIVNIQFNNVINWSLLLLGFFFTCFSIVTCLNNDFKTNNFNKIFKKINDICPFNKFYLTNKIKIFSNILTYKEDKSYFMRGNSYNWFSISFIKYRIKRFFNPGKYNNIKSIPIIGNFIYFLIIIPCRIFWVLLKMYDSIMDRLLSFLEHFILSLRKGTKPRLNQIFRGYSTIEMQLIRTLAVVDGYSSHPIKRKFYELIYSQVFFTCLNDYYNYHKYNNYFKKNYFKYYLIYLYIYVAPVMINGKKYKNIFELYNKETIEEITYEEFLVWVLGLSHQYIGDYISELPIVEQNRLDKEKIRDIIKRF